MFLEMYFPKNTIHKYFLTVTLVMLFVACSGASSVNNMTVKHDAEPEKSALESTEYAVYSALINEMYPAQPDEVIAIEDQTSATANIGGGLSGTLRYVSEHMPERIEQEVLQDFQTKNSQPQPLKNLFKLKTESVLVSAQEMRELFKKGYGWDVFFKKYPASKSLITLSAPGLNHGMDQALVYVGSQSGGKSGAGYYVLLTKENNVWRIKHKVEVWIS